MTRETWIISKEVIDAGAEALRLCEEALALNKDRVTKIHGFFADILTSFLPDGHTPSFWQSLKRFNEGKMKIFPLGEEENCTIEIKASGNECSRGRFDLTIQVGSGSPNKFHSTASDREVRISDDQLLRIQDVFNDEALTGVNAEKLAGLMVQWFQTVSNPKK